ncbi:MAG: hypothetical protein UW37_C0002G0007 [Candidatus Gottesmanbacteria bacterium GW2011_GWA2_44_17]|uniref:Uncharacterized protein n=1 Tax=Candidatus Gottesmanbacteria bacterium GW2011_GWA2_44_17 TaxID=1618444 RepID=A0A0G1JVE1_9BACT|nr:MAG: hypothetical protein UV63_C0007G0018 [Microgenomates group bacterium GW2011_GWC1_43_11]KKT47912.1 MAG: hypothetical protein UW37_C0002G0007 [Candidatus Gottesmanbacteria bacterium GW2011_GWA2_44_17]
MPKNRVTGPAVVQKKKSGCFPLKIIILLFFLVVIGRYLSFWGFPYFDIIYYLRPSLTDEQIDTLINPIAPKGYQYPEPSDTALNRTVDCSVLYSMPEFPRTNPLCLNMFRTSSEDITQALANGSYDRIVFYGERSVFDAPIKSGGTENYIKNLYETVKFMDLIAIPKFLNAYGLSDVSYIKATKPYPYLYYRISNLDESDKVCDQEGVSEQVSGCARSYYTSIIPLRAVGPQLSNARPILRKTDNKRFSYLTHYPSDCFTNDVFSHETSHLLNIAGQSETGTRVMEKWFTEQVAGFFGIYGADLVCGEGTVTSQKNSDKKDVVKALVEFNSPFAPAALSHDYPQDSRCRQAILTVWYAYLAKGDYRENFRRFFMEQRATTPSIGDDTVFAKFLISLDTDPKTKQLLVSKGCSL